MRKFYDITISLYISQSGFAQIHNLPAISKPLACGLGNYSNNDFGSPASGRSSPSIYIPNRSNYSQQQNNYAVQQSRSQNNAVIQSIDRELLVSRCQFYSRKCFLRYKRNLKVF